MEAELVIGGKYSSLCPERCHWPSNNIIPPAIDGATMIDISLTAVPHETPESLGLKIATDERERLQMGKPLKLHLERDDGRMRRNRCLVGGKLSPEFRLPLHSRQVKAAAEV